MARKLRKPARGVKQPKKETLIIPNVILSSEVRRLSRKPIFKLFPSHLDPRKSRRTKFQPIKPEDSPIILNANDKFRFWIQGEIQDNQHLEIVHYAEPDSFNLVVFQEFIMRGTDGRPWLEPTECQWGHNPRLKPDSSVSIVFEDDYIKATNLGNQSVHWYDLQGHDWIHLLDTITDHHCPICSDDSYDGERCWHCDYPIDEDAQQNKMFEMVDGTTRKFKRQEFHDVLGTSESELDELLEYWGFEHIIDDKGN